MFTSEEGALPIVELAVSRYEEHFEKEFPLFDYIHITKDENHDVSVKGAEKFSIFINNKIAKNKSVYLPKDYYERVY